MAAADQATWKAMTPEETGVLQKSGSEAVISPEPNNFKVDPQMSYVPKKTRRKRRGVLDQ